MPAGAACAFNQLNVYFLFGIHFLLKQKLAIIERKRLRKREESMIVTFITLRSANSMQAN